VYSIAPTDQVGGSPPANLTTTVDGSCRCELGLGSDGRLGRSATVQDPQRTRHSLRSGGRWGLASGLVGFVVRWRSARELDVSRIRSAGLVGVPGHGIAGLRTDWSVGLVLVELVTRLRRALSASCV